MSQIQLFSNATCLEILKIYTISYSEYCLQKSHLHPFERQGWGYRSVGKYDKQQRHELDNIEEKILRTSRDIGFLK